MTSRLNLVDTDDTESLTSDRFRSLRPSPWWQFTASLQSSLPALLVTLGLTLLLSLALAGVALHKAGQAGMDVVRMRIEMETAVAAAAAAAEVAAAINANSTVTNPPGPMGPMGPKGPPGPQGPQGPPGPQSNLYEWKHLGGKKNETFKFKLECVGNCKRILVETTAAEGDLDLYGKEGTWPILQGGSCGVCTCKSRKSSSDEVCEEKTTSSTQYYVILHLHNDATNITMFISALNQKSVTPVEK